jgi:putative acetyltransferase
VVVGHPNYYPRFGFVPARTKGIDCEFEAPDEAWMALELKEGGLVGRVGTVLYRPEFKEGN